MATVSVSANNTRVDDSEAYTGWSSRGSGPGGAAEPPLSYQGTNTANRKVTSATGAGIQYDPVADGGAAVNMTTTANSHWIVKFIVTDPNGLRANDGVRIIIGDGANEYAFVVAGTDAKKSAYASYLLRSATIIIPVNPNISGYRDTTHSGANGSVTLTAVDQFGIDAEFATPSAKSENVGVDAIDLGTGLTLVGGDGADPDGAWTSFVAQDQGVTNNRWGYASSLYGTVIVFFGQMTIGTASAAGFLGLATTTVLWPDGLFAAGFSRAFCDLQNASTIIEDRSTHNSLGTTAVEDTRADFVWSGTSGSGLASHTLNNFRNYVMTSAVTLDGANLQIVDLTQGGGTIDNTTIRCNSASGVAVCNDASFGLLSNVTFLQTGSGHAIEITSTGTYSFTNLFFGSGFGANGSNSAAIYNNSGGAVTINVSGGDTPTYRNGTGASTTVNNSIAWTLKVVDAAGAAVTGCEVTVTDGAASPTELFHVESSATGTEVYSFAGAISGNNASILVLKSGTGATEPFSLDTVHPSSATTTTLQITTDRIESNP